LGYPGRSLRGSDRQVLDARFVPFLLQFGDLRLSVRQHGKAPRLDVGTPRGPGQRHKTDSAAIFVQQKSLGSRARRMKRRLWHFRQTVEWSIALLRTNSFRDQADLFVVANHLRRARELGGLTIFIIYSS